MIFTLFDLIGVFFLGVISIVILNLLTEEIEYKIKKSREKLKQEILNEILK